MQDGHNLLARISSMASGYSADPLGDGTSGRPDGNLHRETNEVTPIQPHIPHMGLSSQSDLPPNSFEDMVSRYRFSFEQPRTKLLKA